MPVSRLLCGFRLFACCLTTWASFSSSALAYEPIWWSPELPSWIPIEDLKPGTTLPLPDNTPIDLVEPGSGLVTSLSDCVSTQEIQTIPVTSFSSRESERFDCALEKLIRSNPGEPGVFCPSRPRVPPPSIGSSTYTRTSSWKGTATASDAVAQGSQNQTTIGFQVAGQAEKALTKVLSKIGINLTGNASLQTTSSTTTTVTVTVSAEGQVTDTQATPYATGADLCWTHFAAIEVTNKYVIEHHASPKSLVMLLCTRADGSHQQVVVTRGVNLPTCGGHERSIGLGLSSGGSSDAQGNDEEEVHA
jgi:hypothetical protein